MRLTTAIRLPATQNFAVDGATHGESLGADSLNFDRFRDVMRCAQGHLCKIFLRMILIASRCLRRKKCARARKNFSRAMQVRRRMCCKKSIFHRYFCDARIMRACRRASFARWRITRVVRRVKHVRQPFCASRTHIVKRSRCFFHRSVVNGV